MSRREFLRTYGRKNRPCVLTDTMPQWRAQTWTFDWFRATHGDVRFAVGQSSSRTWSPREMALRDYIDAVLARTGSQDLYLASTAFLDRIPSLQSDFAFPDYTWWSAASNTLMFMGGAGARTPLHFDYSHTLLAQVVGRKRFRLFAPHRTPELAPLPRELYQTFSRVELPADAAIAEGPIAADYDFVLEPGEMLFLPFSWWHAVDSLDPTISVTRSWWTPGLALTEAPRLAADSVGARLRQLRTSARTSDSAQSRAAPT
jgi:lysine-specific demethylase 8